ncbi:LysR family transcriptional regulator [Histidinibacterium lentulum]|uniref:LysR family transcriptional regulator n=1 Tax=Histidinibacterium lentulum TaxID=2480588 RepID=A0A3N2QXY9_9RHOB|nr:LysR family transcriptional regulator [Histidinibacterium lentulum]ROU00094.1 LysR family transcriptional regulator [Histidinibacterium lentulum]
MELRQLRYFLGVVAAGSFGKAASRLHVAQPALSRQIQALEHDLGVKLLHRSARGVEATEAGQKLLEHAEYVLKAADHLRVEVRHLGSEPAGEMVIGMPPSLAYLVAPELIRRCKSLYPKVSIRLIEALSVFLVDWVELGKIDLAILTVGSEGDAIERRELAIEELVLCGVPELLPASIQDVRLEDLRGYPIVITHGFLTVLEPWFASTRVRPTFEMELDSIPILRELIRRGEHCTIVPYSMVHDDAISGKLRVLPIREPDITRSIDLARSTRRPKSITMEALGELIAEAVSGIPVRTEA